MDFKGQLTVARPSPSALSPSTPPPPPQAAGLQGPPFPKRQAEPQQTRSRWSEELLPTWVGVGVRWMNL